MVSTDRMAGNLSLSLTFPETKNQIRVVGTPENPEWVASDVCEVLGVGNPRQVLSRFDDDEKGVTTSP